MRKFDFVAQTIMMVGAIVSVAVLIADESAGFWLIILQFFVGCWQMLSASISLLASRNQLTLRLIHFGLAVIYLLFVYVVAVSIPSLKPGSLLTFGLPWLLACFYYFITWRSAYPKSGKSSFLPHLSF